MRSADERTRLRHALDHLRSCANAVEAALRYDAPLGADLAQTVETAALNVSRGIAKHDAFLLAEADLREAAGKPKRVLRRFGYERTPEGKVNNCARENGHPAEECQVCKGDCPDGESP